MNDLGYLLWILALRHGDTARISTLVYLTPFVALLYLSLLRHSPIRPLQLAALMLILAGPLVQGIGRRRGQPRGQSDG